MFARPRRGLPLDTRPGVNPENFVWVFGAGRTGSTWLARMLGDLEGHAVWFEPWVGELFNPDRLQIERRRGKSFILAPHYRETWLGSVRNVVLDAVEARFPDKTTEGYLVIKEPGGFAGAPLLMEALPESRMMLLVRDPRDVVASWLDARRKDSWAQQRKPEGERSTELSGEELDSFVQNTARRYLQNVGNAKRAYDAHGGRKTLVRYEDLRADTVGTLKRAYAELSIPLDAEELVRVVERHSWENIPKEQKGQGKFYRKATPGGWREDLTPKHAKMVEDITAPLIRELYPA
ncbi:MAG: sulfotransferase [Actinomycetota bacterium]